jgi:hypothetical protein
MGMSRAMSLLTLTLTACAGTQGMKPHPPVLPAGQLEVGFDLGMQAAFTDVRNDYDCIENHRPDCPAAGDPAMLGRASLGLATSAPQTVPWLLVGVGTGHGLDLQVGASILGRDVEARAHYRFWGAADARFGLQVAPALRVSRWVSMITPLDQVLAIQRYRLWTATLPVDLQWQLRRGPLLWAGPVVQITNYDLRASIGGMPLGDENGPLSGWTERVGGHFGSAWNWQPVEVHTDVTIAALRTPDATYDGYVALIDLSVYWTP